MDCLALCLLAKERKLSQFKNFNFNSLANIHGTIVGANTSGLFKLNQGNLDGDTQIPCKITLAATDFGIPNPKKIRRIYLGFYADSDVTLTVSADKMESQSYDITVNEEGLGYATVTINQNLFGRFWSITLENTAGGFLALTRLEVLPVPLANTIVA